MSLLQKIKQFLKKSRIIRKIYYTIFPERNINTYIPAIPEVTKFSPRELRTDDSDIRLNLIVPTLDHEKIFGGITTAVKFFDSLTDGFNVKKRIIITDLKNDDEFTVFKDYKIVSSESDEYGDKIITPYCDRAEKTLPVGKNDIFVVTAWWTAYMILPVLRWQAEHYGISAKKLVYLIQDYEPGFYQWSTRYSLSESTYKSELPVVAVFNTEILKNYFDQCGYKFYKEFYFDPSINEKLKECLEKNKGMPRKKQILIYGRPSTPRNAFELVYESLKMWAEKQPDVTEWTILSAGEKHPDIPLSNGVFLKSVGKLTLDEYAKVMSESYLGISLMVSPHPSYPPLEMSSFGIKTITNCFANKDLSGFNQNIISMKNYSPYDISEKMLEICKKYSAFGSEPGCNNQYMNSKDMFSEITDRIRKEIVE